MTDAPTPNEPQSVGPGPQILRGKLNRGRMELLDLSTRNRLIHTPRSSKVKTIEVVDELTPEVFRLLVTEGKTFAFAAGRRPAGEAVPAEQAKSDEIAVLAQPEDDPLDERGIAQRHSDTRLQTRLTSEGLQKRLLTLYLDSKTLQEEQGVNILFLALGMLKWFEDQNSDVERFAPLILVPVSLERGNVREKFKLRWLSEDPSPNLSLTALLKRQFGLELPQFTEGDESFDSVAYLDRVRQAISGQTRWQVGQNDIVLGFFSFAKFLMYRDLDLEVWPEGIGLSNHPIVSGLLGDGFPGEEALIGEDEPIDSHIPPENLVHIVDADSSQTLAIHEVRRDRNLVIQGPPGTGKSQTIANAIASAIVDGKKILFVAEKMAALEVVKRRLDTAGVGDVCLELHSNKANKRIVLEELRRTWELGKPNGGVDGAIVRQLTQYRDALNSHAARLHRRNDPSSLTPYQVIGHLVRLRHAGQGASQSALESSETWTRHDREEREYKLRDLAKRIEIIGLPAQHPWRGVRLLSILPMELERFVARIAKLQDRLSTYNDDLNQLGTALGIEAADSFATLGRFTMIGARVAIAPDLESTAINAKCWSDRVDEIADLVSAGKTYTQLRQTLSAIVTDAAWDTDVKVARQQIASHGAGLFRWLSGDYKRAQRLLASILVAAPPKRLPDRIKLIDQLIAGQKAAADLMRNDALGGEAFAARWRRDRSDWSALSAAIDWNRDNGEPQIGNEVRRITAAVDSRAAIAATVERLMSAEHGLSDDVAQLLADLKLDLKAAFSETRHDNLSFARLRERFVEWVERAEDLSKWIAYTAKEDDARSAGLGEFVDRLESGGLNADSVVSEFEMSYYEVLLSAMAKADPELARFDGEGQTSTVDEFRKLDRKRIALAQREVASAHHQRLPRTDGGAGPLGVLKGEIARKRGHMPIRQLMKRAGPAIQALKPVFMMSPLSVAQYLEPGVLQFDLLMVDEARVQTH